MFPLSNASFTSLCVSLFLSIGLSNHTNAVRFSPLKKRNNNCFRCTFFFFFLFYVILCPFLSPQAETNQPCRLPLYLVIIISEERYLACRHSRCLVARRSIELNPPPPPLAPTRWTPPRSRHELLSISHRARTAPSSPNPSKNSRRRRQARKTTDKCLAGTSVGKPQMGPLGIPTSQANCCTSGSKSKRQHLLLVPLTFPRPPVHPPSPVPLLPCLFPFAVCKVRSTEYG